MEVINIDSSDEDDGVPTNSRAACRFAAERRFASSKNNAQVQGQGKADNRTLSRSVTLSQAHDTTQSDDDHSSVSSSDSIWETEGLLASKPKASTNATEGLLVPSKKPKAGGGLKRKNPSLAKPMFSLDGTSEDELEIVGGPTTKKMGVGIKDIKGEKGSDEASDSQVHSQKKQKCPDNDTAELLPPEVPLPVGATWRITLLMDHREFGCGKSTFLKETEKKINKHFCKGKMMNYAAAEITTLDSADYMFVARLISNTTGEIVDERVLDVVIERKNIVDLAECHITKSKREYCM